MDTPRSDRDPLAEAQQLREYVARHDELEAFVARTRRRNVVVSVLLAALGVGLIVALVFGFLLLRNDDHEAQQSDRQFELATYLTGLSQQLQCNNRVGYETSKTRQEFFEFIADSIATPGATDLARAAEVRDALRAATREIQRINRTCPSPPVPDFVRAER